MSLIAPARVANRVPDADFDARLRAAMAKARETGSVLGVRSLRRFGAVGSEMRLIRARNLVLFEEGVLAAPPPPDRPRSVGGAPPIPDAEFDALLAAAIAGARAAGSARLGVETLVAHGARGCERRIRRGRDAFLAAEREAAGEAVAGTRRRPRPYSSPVWAEIREGKAVLRRLGLLRSYARP